MREKVLSLILVMGLMAISVRGVMAGPHMTLTPTSGTFTNGSTFTVTVGVNSGTEKVIAMDVVMSFDATKLEIASVTKASDAVFDFSFDANTPIIRNETGKMEITLAPKNMSVYSGEVAVGSLLTINFKAKAVGTASVNFTCQAGQVNETNIINQSSVDVVDCGVNQSGSYVIQAGSGGDTPTATPTPTTGAGAPTATGVLPQTGTMDSMVGLTVFGLVSVISAFMLRWL
jgi:LPXTG-motif cell wall-anchored protein